MTSHQQALHQQTAPADADRPTSMNAWTTRGDGVENLRRGRVPIPAPGPAEVLLKMTAWSLNYRDLLVIGGIDGWKPSTDVVPISDGVGTVVAAGPAVTRLKVGDRVSATFLPKWRRGPLTRGDYQRPVGGPVNRGMLAEYVLLDEEEAAHAPASLTDAQAATLPVAAVTAWHAIARRSCVQPGDTVLIHGTGGVALFALQIATALGARVAITSSSDTKLARARDMGAVATINYRTHGDVALPVLEWTGPEGVDHVIETIGGDNLNLSLQTVKVGGTISFIGLIAGQTASVSTYEFVTKNVTIHGIETGSREMLEELAAFIDRHGVQPVIDSTWPIDQVADALAYLRDGRHFGKIVLTP
jgi:NADPH:quinone reductase-like Zn-dependent oxidoreductase